MPEKASMTKAIPSHVVSDLKASMEHYESTLGFEVAFTWGEPPCYAGIKWDDVELHLFPEDEEHGKKSGNSASMLIVNNVTALHDELNSRGANITQELK